MKRFFSFFLVCLLLFLLFPVGAFAATANAQIQLQPKTIAKADAFVITLSFSSTKEPIGALQATLSYDAKKIRYQSGGGPAVELSGGTGGISDIGGEDAHALSYELHFVALETGAATFAISSCEIVGQDSGKTIGSPSVTYQFSIEEPAPAETPSPSPSFAPDAHAPMEITWRGKKMLLFTDLSDIPLPDGFSPFSLEYQGQAVAGAKNDAGVCLVYLMNAGLQGNWFLYDANGNFALYLPFSVSQNFVFLPLPENQTFPGYRVSSLQLNGKEIPVFAPETETGFYLVYAKNLSSGKTGYFWLDAQEGTLQDLTSHSKLTPVSLPDPAPSETAETANAGSGATVALALLGGLFLGLLVALFCLCRSIRAGNRQNNND